KCSWVPTEERNTLILKSWDVTARAIAVYTVLSAPLLQRNQSNQMNEASSCGKNQPQTKRMTRRATMSIVERLIQEEAINADHRMNEYSDDNVAIEKRNSEGE
ncbi:hypothetical protein KI387_008659, partial [Taxus chinensis]